MEGWRKWKDGEGRNGETRRVRDGEKENRGGKELVSRLKDRAVRREGKGMG